MASLTSLMMSIRSSWSGEGVRQARSDLASLRTSMTEAERSMATTANQLHLVRTAAVALAPAMAPIAGAATAAAGATAALGTSAGTALGAYGAAMTGAIKRTLEMQEAGKKLSPVQSGFVKSVDNMKGSWERFIRGTESMTLSTATIAVNAAASAVGKFTPLIAAAHPAIIGVANAFKAWVERGDGLQRFIDTVMKYGVPALDNLVTAGKNVLSVLGTGFRAFAPLGESVAAALAKGSAALKGWADGGGFTRFIDKVRENAPQVKEFFNALGAAAVKLGQALVGLGPLALGLSTSLLKIVAALPVGVVQALVIAFIAFKAAMTGLLIIKTVSTLIYGLRVAWFALNLVFAASPIGLIIIAIMALVAVFVVLWTKCEWFRNFWKMLWEGIKVAAVAVWHALQVAWHATINAMQVAWTAVSSALSTAWNAVWNALKLAAETVWNALKTAWGAFINALQLVWTTVSTALTTAWNTVWNALKIAAEVVWTALTAAWNAFITGLQLVWTTVSTALQLAWTTVWNALKTAAEVVWTALTAAWNAFITGLQLVWTTVSAAFQLAWTTVWNAVKTAAETVWNALRTAWQTFVSWIGTAWTAVSTALQTAWTTVWNAIKTAAETVWNALRTAWDTFIRGLQTIWTTVSSALSTAWTTVWNAIKTAAETVWNALRTAWQTFVSWIGTAWTAVSGALSTAWNTVWNAMKTAAEVVWTALRAAWQAFLTGVQTIWTTVSTALSTAWNTVWNAIKTAAETVWNAIRAAWTAFTTFVRTTWDTFIAAFRVAWQAGWDWVSSTAKRIWDWIGAQWRVLTTYVRAVWDAFITLFKTAWQAGWDWVSSTAKRIWDWIGDQWKKLTSWLQEVWNTFSGWIKDKWADTWNAVKEIARDVWNGIMSTIEKAINGVIGMINGLIKGFNKITDKLGLEVTIGEIGPVSLPKFADGGMVTFAYGGMTGGPKDMRGGGALSGYAPGRDTVPALLSKGEGVLTPEAVRGLGGPSFVNSANRTYAGHRGAGSGRKLGGIPQFAAGGMVGSYVPFAVGGMTADALKRAGVPLSLVSQGEYSHGSKSAGTHAGGGVVDISSTSSAMVAKLRAAGFAAWARTGAAWKGNEHIHAVLMNHPALSGPARSQVSSFKAGGDGLGAGGGGGGVDLAGMFDGKVGKILRNIYRGINPLEGIGGGIAEFFGGGVSKNEEKAVAPGRKDQKDMGPASGRVDGGGVVGPGGVITGGDSSTNPDAEVPRSKGPANAIVDTLDFASNFVGGVASTGAKTAGKVGLKAAKEAGGAADVGDELMKMLGPIVLSLLSRDYIAEGIADAIKPIDDFKEAGVFGDMLRGMGQKLTKKGVPDYLMREQAKAPPIMLGGTGGGNVNQWRGLAAAALAKAGLDGGQLDAFMRLMQAESGGNPGAANLWDSNAKIGQASRGLMQVIPSTFAAHRDPSLPNNIMDPMANMVASARYIKSRYGGKVPGSPYATGTNSASAGLHLVGEHGPEMVAFGGGESVFTAAQTKSGLAGLTASTPAPTPALGEEEGMTAGLEGKSFDDVMASAQLMAEVVKQSWDAVVAQNAASAAQMVPTFTEITNKFGVEVPAAIATMQTASNTAWADMNLQSLTQWTLLRDTVFAEFELHMGTTVPAMALAMQTAYDAAWLQMQTFSTTTWGTMRDTTFAEFELHMGTTVPAMALAMQTAFDAAWLQMQTFSTATWTVMRDTTFAEFELHMGTTVPAMALAMQTASDLAWTTMQETSTTQWTTMRDDTFIPFETHMQETAPAAAQAMSEAVGAAFTEMVATITEQLDAAIAKIQEFIEATEAAIAAAAALAEAQAAAAASGGGGGALGGASGSAADALARAGITSGMIVQGPYSNSVSASAGTHSGGGVYDIASTSTSVLNALIQNGFAAWIRAGGSWAGNEHIHAVYSGATDLSPQAAWQLEDFKRGGSGLGIPGNLSRGTHGANKGWSWVGEHGPELMQFRGGEQVMPNRVVRRRLADWNDGYIRGGTPTRIDTDRAMARTGSNGSITVEIPITVQGDMDRAAVDAIHAEVVPALKTLLQTGTGRRG